MLRLGSSLLLALLCVVVAAQNLVRASPRALPILVPVEVVSVFVTVAGWNGLLRHLEQRRISRRRAEEYGAREAADDRPPEPEERGPLGRWLALAGYRRPEAARTYVLATAAALGLGALALLWLRQSTLMRVGLHELERFPSAIGEILLPVLSIAPWIILAVLGCAPWLSVRSARRRIVTEVEQDLPLLLELLATLGESGLGFDAAIARVIASQPDERPLTAEFRTFQRETLTGRPRIEALRRLARRLDVPSLTIFISAVAQAEQVGSGIAGVLRRQAEDARNRRRDRALNLAQSLPVKLLFPLVICFLPAIFVVTLGPIFLQFFNFAEELVNRGTPP